MIEDNNDSLCNIDPDNNIFNQSIGTCNSFTLDQYVSNITQSHHFSLLNYNIRSFHCNKQNFEVFLESIPNQFNTIVLTETWNTSHTLDLCFFDDYNSHHTYRSTGRGGGVSVFTLNTMDSIKIDELSWCTDSIESCVVKIMYESSSVYIVGIYRPPRGSIESFILLLETLLSSDLLRNKFVIFAGDINVDLLNGSGSNTIDYLNCMQSFHMLPLIDKITRVSNVENGISGSILDHIFINKLITYSSGVILHDMTDHYPTYIELNIKTCDKYNPDSKKKITFRNYNNENMDKFAEKLDLIDWNSIFTNNNVNESFEKYQNLISEIYCECFPLKIKYISINRLSKPWLNQDLLKLVKLKSEYHSLYRRGILSKEFNNKFRNMVTSRIRKAENYYYLNNFRNFGRNGKHSWNMIKNLTGSNKSSKSFSIISKLNNYDEKLSKIESFNNYFCNIGKQIDSQNFDYDQIYPEPNFTHPNSFVFFPVTENEIDKIIINLKSTKSDINTIPVNIFKKLRYFLLHPLKILINMSFQEGIFPDQLKLARITPIHKSGDDSDPSNFRPISCLSYFSKIFEKCVKNRLVKFCNKYSLINSAQFGFQQNKSTCDALIHLTEVIYESLDNRNNLLAVMIDLKKAFDTVNHKILLKKLECYGIRDVQLDWFASYLYNRKCFIEVEGIKSKIEYVNIGVPQGSVLGPILFLLYINDISKISSNFSTTLFADDTTITISDQSFDNLISHSNRKLQNIYNWTKENRLTLNANKTLSLLFSNKKSLNSEMPNIFLGDEPIQNVDSCKFLGVFIDKNLNFIPHINYISNKISKHIGILYKIKDKLTLEAKLSYYYAFVYPYLSYNVCVWGSTYSSHIQRIIILQKKVIRIITNSSYTAHTRPLFSQLGILEFEDVLKFDLLKYVHKSISKNIFSFNNNRASRDPYLIKPTFHRLSKTQHAFSFQGPTEWNKLPLHLRTIVDFRRFKLNLKRYLLERYSN